MTDILQLRDLTKSFSGIPIIRGVSLSITAGERHAVIGPNGAGKSTLFHLISGLYTPTSGNILLDGRSIAGLKPYKINRLGLGRSFQITNIFPRLSVFENVRIGILGRHGHRFTLWRRVGHMAEVNAETDALLEAVGLAARRDALAGELPYSNQRALEIAMTLATGASVILLDEPTAGMSTEESMHFIELIKRATAGKTLVVIEHDMNVVFSLCDRISVLVYGEVIASGSPEYIKGNMDVRRAYLGDLKEAEA